MKTLAMIVAVIVCASGCSYKCINTHMDADVHGCEAGKHPTVHFSVSGNGGIEAGTKLSAEAAPELSIDGNEVEARDNTVPVTP